ncbi:hypothetical protein [Bacteroides congonensis]|uniref:hypothetical protein n=1 Tax=Bacteroides congonensis TaxID=1871006 RepID=UPI00093485A7|nr:hypothetical protein [Bacteroides congonensis]
MKQIKYLSFIPFLALLCLMTGCENDKDVYYPYVNVPLTTHNPVLVEGEVLHIGIGLDGVNYRVESDNEDVVTAEVVGNEILLTGGDIGSTIVRLSDDSYNRALMTVEVRKLQELTLESLPEGVEVLRLDNDGVILREMKILTGNGGYTVTNSAPEAINAEIVEDPDVTGGYKLVLGGKANVEQATITVTDSRNKSATLKVRVTNPIRPVLFDKEGTLEGEYVYEGTPQQISFNITSGNGGYTVKSLNEGVATVAVSGTTVTVTVVGDGGTIITVTDQEKESRSIDLWVPLNLDDPTPRIYWDGYRADINTAGVASTGSYATPKDMYWYQQNGEVKDTYYVYFNGGWANNLNCVNAANRNPKFETTINDTKTSYTDKAASAVKLTEFILEKRIGTGPTSHPHIYFISLKTEDGKRGFIVHRWNE